MLILKASLDVTVKALRYLAAVICRLVYSLIAGCFDLFINLTKVKVLSSDDIKPIYQRITMILAIVMIFYVTFEFVKYVIQPDQMTDKEKGGTKVITKMIIVLLLIAFVPDVFSFAYKLQNAIIERGVLSQIILNENIDNSGNGFAADMFNLFYYYDEDYWEDADHKNECVDSLTCYDIVEMNIEDLKESGKLPNVTLGLNKAKAKTISAPSGNSATSNDDAVALITFDGLFAVGVGCFILYILILYCIDVGTRIFQLAFLQIIAPIPIIGYLMPKKDGIFQKWVKQCTTTYLDLFLRLGIIYFILQICAILSRARQNNALITGIAGGSGQTIIYIVLVLGLLLFAQRAPKMLKELFPSTSAASGNFGLKAGERVAPMAARAIGATLGAAKVGGVIARRAAWAHARNKANNRHSRFTKEGREERKQDREHRRQLKTAERRAGAADAGKNLNKTKEDWLNKRNSDSTYKSLTQQLRNKSEEIKNAKTPEEKERLQREAQEIGRKLKERNDELKNTDEFKNFDAARKTYANTQYEKDRRKKARELLNSQEAAKNNLTAAEQKENEAKQKLEEAEKTGNAEQIEAAKKELKEATTNKETAQSVYNQTRKEIEDNNKDALMFARGSQEEIEEMKETANKEVTRAHEQVVEDKNRHYQGAAGVAVSSAIGTIQAAAQGSKATKLSEVGKNLKQATQNDKARVQAVQKYYDEGGTGWVDRTIQHVEKNIGVPTAYERTILETKPMEREIKNYSSEEALAKNFSSSVDASENVSRGKARELKTTAKESTSITSDPNKVGNTAIKTGLKDEAGRTRYVEAKPGETLGEITRRYQQEAIDAHNANENASTAFKNAVSENTGLWNRYDAASNKDEFKRNLTHEEQATIADIEQKQQAAEAASIAERDAKFAAEQVEKNVARYAVADILTGLGGQNNAETRAALVRAGYHGGTIESVSNSLELMRIASQDPIMAQEVREYLTNNGSSALYPMFTSGKITGADQEEIWDAYDMINNAVKAAQTKYGRLKTQTEEKKRTIETSNQTYAEKAAHDYNPPGSSGGK